jgi:hypothetical protein
VKSVQTQLLQNLADEEFSELDFDDISSNHTPSHSQDPPKINKQAKQELKSNLKKLE